MAKMLPHAWDTRGGGGGLFKLCLHPRHQHCTDKAQKAETVLSAVGYIYVYIKNWVIV